ncbi:hypothetical protein T459_16783 [Capsicum annuum]|uniref:Carboxypeptidase A inhibitor-like domain-containing protein n=1 Tax=Capsicum annuum TaxID=4072 RepID=A0A2G2ZA05_CAPAN|nr:hypothetical protein T459_16783 [Capsicum annuum]
MYAVDMSGTSKLQVMGSCSDDCSSHSDCGGWTLCQWCWEHEDFNGRGSVKYCCAPNDLPIESRIVEGGAITVVKLGGSRHGEGSGLRIASLHSNSC